MADHKAHSFIAALQIAESPVNSLDCLSTGPVIVATPNHLTGPGVDGAKALGMLNGTDEDWQHGQELGLITFDKGADPCALLLYFRHSDAGYRLYVRSGPHLGKSVFTNVDGQVTLRTSTSKEPSVWSLIDVQTGNAFDLTLLEDGRREIQLISSDGHPLEIHNLYPVGGFLACYAQAQPCTLSLLIEQRGVDWLDT